ncbi:MAG: hypothetical protein JSR96_13100 [Proteobacteria bacterium]|nr:hypothetical protein [Pseudomonadota bacterium]
MAKAKPARRLAQKSGKPADKAEETPAGKASASNPPTSNPVANLVLADFALRGGTRLLRHLVERNLLSTKTAPGKARGIVNGRSVTKTLLSTALVRIASRSVPGALVVGGGLLAKTLFDRRRDNAHDKAEARAKGKTAVSQQAEKDGQDSGKA